MNAGNPLLVDWSSRMGWTLLHSLWQGTLISILLAAVLRLLRNRPAHVRYLAGLLAMGAILLSSAVTFERTEARTPPPASAGSYFPHDIDAPAALSFESSVPPQSSVARGRFHVASESLWMRARLWLTPRLPLIAGFWAAGVLLLSSWNLGGWIAAQRLRVIGVRLADESIATLSQTIARRLEIQKTVRIAISMIAETPMVIGWLRPTLLIPAALLTGLTPKQIEGILAHELAHIRRHDYLINLFQVLAETLLFYHPALWWISRRVRLEREQCCDEIAVSLTEDRCGYAESLAAIAQMRLGTRVALAAGGSDRGQLLHRVRNILRLGDSAPRPAAHVALAAVLLIIASVIPMSLLRAGPVAAPRTPIADTSPAAGTRGFRANCVLTSLQNGKRTTVAAPSINLEDGKETSFLYAGSLPVIIERQPGDEAGLEAKLRADQEADGKLHVVARLRRRGMQRSNDLAPEQADALRLTREQDLINLEKRLSQTEDLLVSAQREKQQKQARDAEPYTPQEIAQIDPGMASLLNRLGIFQSMLNQLTNVYGERYPTIISMHSRLQILREQIRQKAADFNAQYLILQPADGALPLATPIDLSHLVSEIAERKRLLKEAESALKHVLLQGGIETDQIVKPGEPVAVELADGTRLEASIHPIGQ